MPYAGHLALLLNEELQEQPPLKQRRMPNAKPIEPSRNLYKTLNILKGGFYSLDEEVARCCISVFLAIVQRINELGGDIVSQLWDWFISANLVEKAK